MSSPDRLAAIQSLYVRNYPYITDLIYAHPRMTFADEAEIVQGVAKHLGEYDEDLTDEAFRHWVAEVLVPVLGFYGIKRHCEPFVRSAIWRSLQHHLEPNRFDDYAALVPEIEQEVWLWTFLNLGKLAKRGSARISTRLYARARIVTWAWLKKHRSNRLSVLRRLYDLPNDGSAQAVDESARAEEEAEKQAMSERKKIQQKMKNWNWACSWSSK